jgi:uncharacterized protein YfaS (alpha-2-macroglobulin family)
VLVLLAAVLYGGYRLAGGLFARQPRPEVITTPGAIKSPATPVAVEILDQNAPLPPRVIASQPTGGQELAPDGEVVVEFDQAMDPEKTTKAWQVTGPGGTQIVGEVTWPTPRTLRFTPGKPLESGQVYLASLSTQAASSEGLPLAEPLSLQFQTVGDLQISQVFPADGAVDVANNAVITVIFNRPVVPLVISEDQQNLPQPLVISPTLIGSGEWINTSVYAFHAEQPLRGATTYSVLVKAGLANSTSETRLLQDYAWSFTTVAPGIASLELADGTQNPEQYRPNVPLETHFAINFLQPMDKASVEANLTLSATNTEPVSLATLWNETATRVVFTPTVRLQLGTNYILKLDPAAQSVDGGTLREGLDWNFTTVLKPAIVNVDPADGSHNQPFNPMLQIMFASPMSISSIKDKIVITPKLSDDAYWWYDEFQFSYQTFGLQAGTTYKVTLLPGMRDIYSNTIPAGRTVSFTTGDYDPSASLQMPYMPAVFRVGGSQEFYAVYRNVGLVQLRLYKLPPEKFVSFLSGSTNQGDYAPPESDLIWQEGVQSTGKRNEEVLTAFQPQTSGGEALPQGIYFLTLDSPSVSHTGQRYADTRLILVSSANITYKATQTDALAWVTDLQSGVPLAGVPLTVYDAKFQVLASGVTDRDGLLSLIVPPPGNAFEARYVISTDMQHFGVASTDWGSGASPYDFGVSADFYSPGSQPKAYVYTERPIYRPGQPVYFKGIARLDDDLKYSLPADPTVRVTIDSFDQKVYEQELPLSSFGTFDGLFQIDQDAPLGSYTLQVWLAGRDTPIGVVSFNVAEYRRPEFMVNVTGEPADVLGGDNFQVTVSAEFYSGGAVANAPVNWTLTATPFYFNPQDELSRYRFRDDEIDTEYYFQPVQPPSTVVAQGTDQTGPDGKLILTLPADLTNFKTSARFIFEATVTDVAGSAVSGRVNVTAHRSQLYVGVRPVSYIGVAGKEQSFEAVAVDWDGKPLAGQKVAVDIVERRWYSVQQQDAQGNVTWTSSVQEIPVASLTNLVTNDKGLVQAPFTPPNGGIFRAKVSALDSRGNEARASDYMWVSGEAFVPWRQTNDRSFQLVANQQNYTPGDTAEILIASPFQGEAYALLTVERGHIRSSEVLKLTTNSTVYRLPITPEMAPNVYVSVVIVKGVDDTNPRPNFKVGLVELKVDKSERGLTVEVIPDRPQVGPGEKVTYTIRVRDYQGNPVQAELSLGLSDLATLSLADPNSPPILDYFYDHRNLSVMTTVPINLDLDEYNALIREHLAEGRGMGSGGGKGGGELGVIEVRQDFPDTAFWEAHVVTDQNGEASVTVTLPDNLTIWRMDARGVTLDTRVGEVTQDITSTKPLLVRPQTPRFLVAGDMVQLGAAVHNNTDASLSVQVGLQAEGVSLSGEAVRQLDIPARQQAYVTWDTQVNPDAQRVDLVFSATGGGYSDASRPTLGTLDNQGIPVYRYEAPETVGTSGQMLAGGTVVESISLPATLDVKAGELDIKVSPSLAAGMTDALAYLEAFPYDCIEQTISRFLPNVITTRALHAAGLSDPTLEQNLATQVSTALQRLYNSQNPDGGWGWWGGQKSDVQTSAYVVLGMAEAGQAGYTVDEGTVSRGVSYLRNQLKPIATLENPSELNQQAFILYVLARTGNLTDNSRVIQLYDQRQRMAIYARALLAYTLKQIDAQDPRLSTLLSDIGSAAVVSATGAHWEEAEQDIWNWNTDTRTTAIVLSVLSDLDVKNPLNANAVRWLMSHRESGYWKSTQETAWSLMALTNWMVASGELQANYQYAVGFNGEKIGEGSANTETLRQNNEMHIDISKLLKGEINRLAFARTDGTGNLYYTAHLNVSLPVGQIKALDQGIVLSRSYYPSPDGGVTYSNTPVTQAKQGDLLLVRLTIVAPHDLHYLVVTDPLPAGLEAVDQTLNTSQQSAQAPQEYAWNDLLQKGWGWWYFTHVQLRDEKAVLSVDYLPAGTYVYTYVVRAGSPGTFNVIPPTGQEFYFPEVYGRGDGSLFVVTP